LLQVKNQNGLDPCLDTRPNSAFMGWVEAVMAGRLDVEHLGVGDDSGGINGSAPLSASKTIVVFVEYRYGMHCLTHGIMTCRRARGLALATANTAKARVLAFSRRAYGRRSGYDGRVMVEIVARP
jgi:hypothetical protein